jgi:hypothetical protein
MKIITWNVNGLRAAMKKGAWEWLRAQGADVICLQEIKVRPEQLTEEQHRSFAPYLVLWNPAGKPGYSGVASLLRDPAPETAIGTGNPDFDGEGRVIITRHPGFLLFNTYFPSGQRGSRTRGLQAELLRPPAGDLRPAARRRRKDRDLRRLQHRSPRDRPALPEAEPEDLRLLCRRSGPGLTPTSPAASRTPSGKSTRSRFHTPGGRTGSTPASGISAGAWIISWFQRRSCLR